MKVFSTKLASDLPCDQGFELKDVQILEWVYELVDTCLDSCYVFVAPDSTRTLVPWLSPIANSP